jgi:hypothetical protein
MAQLDEPTVPSVQASVYLVHCESSVALGRDFVTRKQYSCVSASTTWTRGGLVPTDTTG